MAQREGGGRAPGERLAAELRAARDATGLSLRQLRFKVHASDSSLSRYFAGQIVPPWEVVEQLCLVAGRPPAELKSLWELADLERRRPADESGDGGDRGPASQGSTLEGSTSQRSTSQGSTSHPAGPGVRGWSRNHPHAAIAALMTATALLFGGLGLWIGFQLGNGTKSGPVLQQEDACRTWPWPEVTGTLAGRSVVWAQITGARYGDRVWIDVSANAGQTWTQCGPFTTTGAVFSSRAHETGPQWKFRACGDSPIAAQDYPRNSCTGYW